MNNTYRIQLFIASFLIFNFSLFTGSAQTKFGHVNFSSIITSMPGIDSVQNVINNYQTELQAIGEQLVKEFKEKQAAFEQLTNNPNTSQAVIKIKQDELVAMYKRIQEFEDSMGEDIRDKQLELLEPFQTKLINAIKKVAKANHYNYVFDISTLLFSSINDDLTDKVKEEIGIK